MLVIVAATVITIIAIIILIIIDCPHWTVLLYIQTVQ